MLKPFFTSLKLLSRKQRAIFLLLVGSRMLTNLLDVLGLLAIGLLGAMLASGLTDNPSASFAGFDISIESATTYFVVVIVIAGFFFAKSGLSLILLYAVSMFIAKLEVQVSKEIAAYIYSGTLSRVRRFSKGDLHFAVNGSTNAAMGGLLISGSSLMTEGVLFLSIGIVFILVDPTTAVIITLYFILLITVFQLSINGRLKTLGGNLSKNTVGVTNSIEDLTTSFREISSLSKAWFFLDIFGSRRNHLAKDNARLAFLGSLPRFIVETGLLLGVLALIGWQFWRGNFSEGVITVSVFLAGSFRMMAALLPIQGAIASIKSLGPRAELAQDLIVEARSASNHEEPMSQKRNSAANTDDQSGFPVSAQDVTYTHPGDSEPVLKKVSLDVPAGAFAAIVGPSGGGKTTLVDLLIGMNVPDSGTILVDGESPVTLRKRLPGSISYVPQSPGLVAGSIVQNIALGVPAEEVDEQLVWDVVTKAQLGEFVESLPDGIQSDLGKQSDSISGGQKQRLGLARALYSKPRLLVLDEATSALDAGTESAVTKSVDGLGKSTTVLVIAHRLSTIQHADIVFVMESGSITAKGTFSEVRKAVPLIEEYVRLMTFSDD